MHYTVILRLLGILLMLFSFTMLTPLPIALWYQDQAIQGFVTAFLVTLITGTLLWLPTRNSTQELRTREGFLVTVLFWTVLGLFGALPLVLADLGVSQSLSFTDAAFEAISGLTTTGATVITGIDQLPKSILFYRQQIQWLGGMGIIVLAVAVLPMLGIGGMQLYRAETPGPVKDNKLTPRITETAKALWYIYLTLTISCALAYWLAGMSLFDAIGHSFSTVAIGGFSTHDASIGYYNSPLIESIAVIFMIISGINYGLHFSAFKHPHFKHYLRDSECRFYLNLLFVTVLITAFFLLISGTYDLFGSLRYGIFEVVSIATTTGFATADFNAWPSFLPFLIFYTAFVGGCAGSTGGGLKVVRVMLICKQGFRELERLMHPNAILQIKLGNKPVQDRVMEAVWGFFSVYVLVFFTMMMALLATDLDLTTAFSAVGACLNNLGPGLGSVAMHYGDINDTAKWILTLAMLLGRLELFTFLILLTPMFWRR